jgi:hypothetical protein
MILFISLILFIATIGYLLFESNMFNIQKLFKKQPRYDWYLAGPMTGYPEHNHPAFKLAAKLLRNRGYTVWSPAEENDTHLTFNVCMKKDLNAVVNLCRGIVLLNGWKRSLGANTETLSAYVCGKSIRELVIFENKETKDGYELSFCEINPEHYLLPYNVF